MAAKTAKPAGKSSDPLNFESSLARVQEILARLEDGNLPLEEALALYQEGFQVADSCKKQLEQARLQVEIIGQAGRTDRTGSKKEGENSSAYDEN